MRQSIRTGWQRVATLGTLTLVFWLTHGSQVWAQEEDEKPEPKSYVLAYILVVLMVGLALSLICRMGNRRNDVRQDLPPA